MKIYAVYFRDWKFEFMTSSQFYLIEEIFFKWIPELEICYYKKVL